MTRKYEAMESDMAKTDFYENDAAGYEELPELTDAFFDRAELKVGGVVVKRGGPASGTPDRQIAPQLDPAVIEGLMATGPGWQARMNDVLRAWHAEQPAADIPIMRSSEER